MEVSEFFKTSPKFESPGFDINVDLDRLTRPTTSFLNMKNKSFFEFSSKNRGPFKRKIYGKFKARKPRIPLCPKNR